MLVNSTILILLAIVGMISIGFWLQAFIAYQQNKNKESSEQIEIKLLRERLLECQADLAHAQELYEEAEEKYTKYQEKVLSKLLD